MDKINKLLYITIGWIIGTFIEPKMIIGIILIGLVVGLMIKINKAKEDNTWYDKIKARFIL